MSGDVLKEFLVKLGFKVDDATHKKMNGAIGEITKSVNALGIAIDLSLAGMTAFTVKASEALDKMYFATQRTGSAVQDMKAFDYATSQLGGSADAAQASLENLGHFIRSYPGSAQFLERLGVSPDHVHDSAKAMEDLGRAFQKMPFWQAQPYANMLGIDEKTLLAMQSGQFNKWLDDYNQRLRDAGVDETKAAEAGNRLQTALRGLEADANVTGEALMSGPFGKALVWMIDVLDIATKGWAQLLANPSATSKALTDKTIGATEWLAIHSPSGKRRDETMKEMARMRAALAGGSSGSSSSASSGAASFQQVVEYFKGKGWSASQAAGIAANLQAESGLNPGAQNSNGMYGLAQWDTKRRAAFRDYTGHDIVGSSMQEQLDFIQHELETSEKRAAAMLGQAQDPRSAAGAFNDYYERSASDPAQLAMNAKLRGDIADRQSATIHQTTTIQVSAPDPNSAATQVASKQNDVNNNLVRNVQGAIR